jgi:hypothetical protein
MKRRSIALLGSLFVAAACSGGNQDPDGASQLWAKLHTTDYHAWARAPGYPGKTASSAPHGDQVEIWVNPTVQAALDAKKPITAWPDGSLIVKDGYKKGSFELVAVMEKRGNAWYWAEYEADGTVDYSGSPSVCTDCHASGADFVRAFGFPK